MFPPTEEQQLIIDAASTTSDNLLVAALAGAAKTSTLVLVAQALSTVPTLCLAFNKRIATEMQERLPPNCTAKTLNGLGHSVWQQTIGKRLTLKEDKVFTLVREAIQSYPKAAQGPLFEALGDLVRAVKSGKTAGYVPDGHFPNAQRLIDDDEFFNWLDDEPDPQSWDLIRAVSLESIKQGLAGLIDFDDQILLPTIFPSSFPVFPLILVDEAQDLSALNHKMLRKLARKRIIAVGDECQAIYGFRGAHENSMELLQETFAMRKLILSISFRCPQAVVKHAHWRAPHMRYPEWAKPGTITTLERWYHSDIPDNAAILCRNNAPLFRLALWLLKAGRYPQLIGNDIGKNLIKIMKKFGPLDLPIAQVFQEIDKWSAAKKAKSRSPGSIDDQAECMMIFCENAKELGDAIAYAEHLFNSQGPIALMTVHKAKGLEFNDVFILDKGLFRFDRNPQDRNVLYVAQTRAKNSLTYIETETYVNG